LFHHIVESLLACPEIAEVVIDTDSALIKDDVAATFPAVRTIDRPRELLGGEVPMTAVLAHDISVVGADLYLQTHSTNPLLRSETIRAALAAFAERRDEHDSLFTVTPLQARLWTPHGEPVNHDPDVLLRTQDLGRDAHPHREADLRAPAAVPGGARRGLGHRRRVGLADRRSSVRRVANRGP
jgi:CMP-N-acetylneuraminic acid synthetase